ncbi:MAG: glycosyltransferase family 2 protein [Acidimicrobiales bacterium]|nr:glycosyltransferase family 2 protein [Acidimicrobiales bacterium]MDG2217482.1 glycosyltransferase family 2 protein [Acidimicrobiales bacterium]
MKRIVIVIPCFNEAERVPAVVDELSTQIDALDQVEVLLVDDGSTDGTLAVLRELHERYSFVRYLSFTRNFGKEAAMLAGVNWACRRNAAMLIMDADGQHPPAIARKMIESFQCGATHVVAQRGRADESRSRRILARVAYGALGRLVQVQLVNGQGDFRLLSCDLVAALSGMPERNRFSKGLYSWLGPPDEVIEFDPPADLELRRSRWSLRSLLDYSIDGVTSFNDRPLRLILLTGLAVGVASVAYLAFMLIAIWRNGVEAPGYVTIIFGVTMLGSLQLISLGVMGEYIGRILGEVKDRPSYLIREETDNR